MRKLRLFVSSPSDVAAERGRVENVVRRVQSDYDGGVNIEVIRWEESFYSARSTFQDQIASPAEVDLVLCILWKRLGSALPEDYNRGDGSSRTGTEYEFEVAMDAALEQQLPDILMDRKSAAITFTADRVDQERAELQALEGFWRRWIQNEKGHFTAGFKPFGDPDEFEVLLEKDLRVWLSRQFEEVTWPEAKGSPYRGLDVFEEQHAPIYFGRRRAINEVRARLIANAERDNVGFLLIIGASGAGKSSLVCAGLIPALKVTNPIEGVAGWRSVVIRPSELGVDPTLSLAARLCERNALPELLDGDFATSDTLGALWRAAPEAAVQPVVAALNRWSLEIADSAAGGARREARLILAIDQLEELIALEAQARSEFIKLIDALARSGPVWIVATLRSDFYPQMFSIPELMALKDGSRQYDLTVPRQRELEEMVTGPARAAGLSFERVEDGESLDQMLVEDAEASPAALPLLEFTLDRLYESRDRDSRQLTFSAYKRLGGLSGALTRTAEEAFADVSPTFESDPDTVYSRVMRELVAIDETGKATRRVAIRGHLESHVDDIALVDVLLAKRLLTGYTLDTDDAGQPVPVVNITHEALIHHWRRMQGWLERDRELLQVRERTALESERWVSEAGRTDLLATDGKRLEDVRFLKASALALDDDTSAYITASLTRATTLKKRRRAVQITFGIISAMAVLFGIGALLSFDELDNQQRENGRSELRLAQSREKAIALLAQSEFAIGRARRAQGDRAGALKAFTTAMEQADKFGATQRGEASLESGTGDESPMRTVLKSASRPLWPHLELTDATRLTTGPHERPIILPGGTHGVFVTRPPSGANVQLRVIALESKKVVGGPYPFVGDTNSFLRRGLAISPSGKHIAMALKQSTQGGEEDGLRLRIVEAASGRTADAHIAQLPERTIVEFLSEFRLLVTAADRTIREWDIGTTRSFESLPIMLGGDVHQLGRVEHLQPLSETAIAINRRAVWQRSAGGWSLSVELAPIGFMLAGPMHVRGEVAIGVMEKSASLMTPTLAGYVSGHNGRIFSVLPLRTEPILKRIDLSTTPPTVTDIALPVPPANSSAPDGHIIDVVQLQPRPDDDNRLDVLAAFSSVLSQGTSRWFRYEVDLARATVAAGPTLAMPAMGSSYTLMTGAVRARNGAQWLVSASNGIVLLKAEDGTYSASRIAKETREAHLVHAGSDKVAVAAATGVFLVDRDRLFPPPKEQGLSRAATRLNEVASYRTVPAMDPDDGRQLDAILVAKELGIGESEMPARANEQHLAGRWCTSHPPTQRPGFS
jgi:hypothetical protein